MTIRYERLKQDAKEIPDGVVFCVFTKPPPKPFIKTEEQPDLWAFCFKMKGKYAFSTWANDNGGMADVEKSKKQILWAKENGWSGTGEIGMDDLGETSKKYQCLYCGKDTFGTEIEGPCSCRPTYKEKPKSSFIDLF